MSRHCDLTQVAEVQALMDERDTIWNTWKGKRGGEIGAGLGLPSIVAANLGAQMTATDGDDMVLHLLGENMERNAPSCQVKTLLWGPQPQAAFEVKQEPDFVL